MPAPVRDAYAVLEAWRYPPPTPEPHIQLASGETMPMHGSAPSYGAWNRRGPPQIVGGRVRTLAPVPYPIQQRVAPTTGAHSRVGGVGQASVALAISDGGGNEERRAEEREARVQLLREELRLLQEIKALRTEEQAE
jgi:hypothetical protein